MWHAAIVALFGCGFIHDAAAEDRTPHGGIVDAATLYQTPAPDSGGPDSNVPNEDKPLRVEVDTALHIAYAGPVGFYALEVGVGISWLQVSLLGSYAPRGVAYFPSSYSGLHGLQGALMVRGHFPLNKAISVRPGLGVSAGAFGGTARYKKENAPWRTERCGVAAGLGFISHCSERVDVDTMLWMHVELAAQIKLGKGVYLQPNIGLSSALRGWGEGCTDCGKVERDAKTKEIFGSIWDPYFGVALGYTFDLSPSPPTQDAAPRPSSSSG